MTAAILEGSRDSPPAKRSAGQDDSLRSDPAKRARPEACTSETLRRLPSDAALLYNLAFSAWQASHDHYTAAFVPAEVSAELPADLPVVSRADPLRPARPICYRKDRKAAIRALELQLLALDSLTTALSLSGLTEKESVITGLLFSSIGFQLVTALRSPTYRRSCSTVRIMCSTLDSKKLLLAVQSELSRCSAIARQSVSLSLLGQEIEILTIRILLFEGKQGIAKGMIKQAYLEAKDHPAQQYALQLLLLGHEETLGPSGALNACEEALCATRAAGQRRLQEALLLARTRLHFHQRRWDLLSKSIEELGLSCSWVEAEGFQEPPTAGSDPEWRTNLAVHYLLYRCLWEGRLGKPQTVRRLRKEAFSLMDEAAERRLFSDARASGGLYEVGIPGHSASTGLLLQSTPPNLLYVLTYLVAMVSGRDISGKSAKSKTLLFSKGMRDTERIARADDMWDANFSIHHGLHHITDLRCQIDCVRIEVMLEQVHAYLYRSAYQEASKILSDAVTILLKQDATDLSGFVSHLFLLHGQFAHLLGRTRSASRYYRAGTANLVPGSELGIVLAINAMGCEGRLDSRNIRNGTIPELSIIVEQVKTSTCSELHAMGHFLSSLIDTGFTAKTKLRSAWKATHANGNRVLYALLYAFLVSVDVSGDVKSVTQQAETGLALAKALGGFDRPEGVGQASLEHWYATKLLKLRRAIDPDSEETKLMRANLKRSAGKNDDLVRYGTTVFAE